MLATTLRPLLQSLGVSMLDISRYAFAASREDASAGCQKRRDKIKLAATTTTATAPHPIVGRRGRLAAAEDLARQLGEISNDFRRASPFSGRPSGSSRRAAQHAVSIADSWRVAPCNL